MGYDRMMVLADKGERRRTYYELCKTLRLPKGAPNTRGASL